jgi:hypothetical protein
MRHHAPSNLRRVIDSAPYKPKILLLTHGFSPKNKKTKRNKEAGARDFCLQMAAVPVRRNYSEEDKN